MPMPANTSAPLKVRTMLIQLLLLLAAVFLALCALLYWRQDRLIFHPGPNDPQLLQQQRAHRVEISSPHARLEGWWIDNPDAAGQALLVYFGGNGEDVLFTAGTAGRFAASSLLVVNYRGYGGTKGRPSQAAFYEDGQAIYDYVIQRGVPPERIVVMGRSLGSGVASMLAGKHVLGGAILVTPFDSLLNVAAGQYRFFPVKYLLRHPFPSVDWARQSKTPVLVISAEHDLTVPATHAQRLFEAWAGPKEIHQLPGTGHGDIEQHADYYPLINAFLRKVSPGSARIQ